MSDQFRKKKSCENNLAYSLKKIFSFYRVLNGPKDQKIELNFKIHINSCGTPCIMAQRTSHSVRLKLFRSKKSTFWEISFFIMIFRLVSAKSKRAEILRQTCFFKGLASEFSSTFWFLKNISDNLFSHFFFAIFQPG